jgi:hypothetical protein
VASIESTFSKRFSRFSAESAHRPAKSVVAIPLPEPNVVSFKSYREMTDAG